ncbi:hypothetical protein [Streptomyces sp. NPDC059072]|uniref:hypothetical protein n=1 Tax=Streptomyces sp. NPDC059072 TaxID=3346715 RepID=UPI0036BE3226
MRRRARTSAALIALSVAALTAPPTAAYAAQPSAAPAAPTATCTVSAADAADRVTVAGQGFAQGRAALSSPRGGTTSFNVPDGGAFQIGSKPDDRYAVTQGGRTTVCTGGTKAATTPGTTYKAGLIAGWDAVRANCGARPPASADKPFSDGWNKGASVAEDVFCG